MAVCRLFFIYFCSLAFYVKLGIGLAHCVSRNLEYDILQTRKQNKTRMKQTHPLITTNISFTSLLRCTTTDIADAFVGTFGQKWNVSVMKANKSSGMNLPVVAFVEPNWSESVPRASFMMVWTRAREYSQLVYFFSGCLMNVIIPRCVPGSSPKAAGIEVVGSLIAVIVVLILAIVLLSWRYRKLFLSRRNQEPENPPVTSSTPFRSKDIDST